MTIWTKTPPREPGWYWFYGVKSGASRASLAAVQAILLTSSNGGESLVLIGDGSPWYERELEEEYVGVYTPMVMPDLPVDKAWS